MGKFLEEFALFLLLLGLLLNLLLALLLLRLLLELRLLLKLKRFDFQEHAAREFLVLDPVRLYPGFLVDLEVELGLSQVRLEGRFDHLAEKILVIEAGGDRTQYGQDLEFVLGDGEVQMDLENFGEPCAPYLFLRRQDLVLLGLLHQARERGAQVEDLRGCESTLLPLEVVQVTDMVNLRRLLPDIFGSLVQGLD